MPFLKFGTVISPRVLFRLELLTIRVALGYTKSNEDCISWVIYTRTPFGEAFLRVWTQKLR